MSGRKKLAVPPPPSQPDKSRSVSPWVAGGAIALIGILLLASVSLLVQYQDLQGKYSALSSEHDSLKASYSSLNLSYNDLSSRYSGLQITYTSLQSSYTTLQSQYSSLQSNYSSLQSQYSSLQSSYNTLSSSYQTLQTERNGLATKIQTMNTNFQGLVELFNTRYGLGERCKQFITLDDPSIRTLVSQVTGGWSGTDSDLWSDLSQLQTWVVLHVSYSYDTYTPVITGSLETGLNVQWRDDFWRFSTETTRDGHGDCEDMAILLTTMIRCYFKYCVGTLYPAYAMWIAGSSSSHMAVVIPVSGNMIAILDPAGMYITGLNLFVTNWLVPQSTASAMNAYFSYWSLSGRSYDHVVEVFNDSIYKTFSTLSEFISWING
jgi:prefoldin subunit 5